MAAIAIESLSGSELDFAGTGIRLLAPQEIELVAGADWSWAEAAIATAGGMVTGSAGAAAYTWYTGGGVLAAAAAGAIGGAVAGFVGYSFSVFADWYMTQYGS